MSLHDIDKEHDRRLEPKINQRDEQSQRLAKGTTQVQNSLDTTTNGLKVLERKILAETNGITKAIFGFLSSGNKFGFKIAKDGFDAETTSDSNLILSSDYNLFKIVKTLPVATVVNYTTNATPNGNQTAVSTTPHGLTFTPAFIANIVMDASASSQNGNSSSDNYPNPGQLTGWVGSHVTDYVKATVTVDSTNIYFRVIMDTLGFTNGTYTYTANVYLLQETFTVS